MILVAFFAFAVIGQILNVLACLAIDQLVSPAVGVLAFVVLYIGVFWIAWRLALLIFDKEAAAPEQVREGGRELLLIGGLACSLVQAD